MDAELTEQCCSISSTDGSRLSSFVVGVEAAEIDSESLSGACIPHEKRDSLDFCGAASCRVSRVHRLTTMSSRILSLIQSTPEFLGRPAIRMSLPPFCFSTSWRT